MQDFRKLRVWRAAFDLTLEIYRITRDFPREERYGLTAQLRDAANSVNANIAEGCGSDWPKDQARFLRQAMRSGSEVLNHLLVAEGVGYLTAERLRELERRLAEVRRLLLAFLERVIGPRRRCPPERASGASA